MTSVSEAQIEADARYKWKVLVSVVFGLFMVLLDTTAVNVAFATLQREFSANVSASQWVISLYAMALGIATPVSGYFGDRFGAKRVFLSALGIFTFGSLLCGLAGSLPLLIIARAIQGIGGGIALPLGTALLYSAFPFAERGRAMGVFGIAMVSAPALGPILGGWLVDLGHWRWIFFLNIPIGILGVVVGSRWLRAETGVAKSRFDVSGLLLSAVGFGALLYAASIAAERGWLAAPVITAFAVGVVALLAFALVELRAAQDPLLDVRMFAKPVFTLAAVVGWVSVFALFGAEFLMPLYLQVLRGRTAFEAGVLLLPMALTSAIFAPIAGRLFDRIGARPLAVTGFALLAYNTWQLTQLTTETSLVWIQWLLAIRGAALGLTVQMSLLTSMTVIPLPQISRASALLNATRNVVQSLSIAVLATILMASLSPELSAQARQFQERMPGVAAQEQAQGTDRVELCKLPDTPGVPLPPVATNAIREFCTQYVTGFDRAYMMTFYFSLLAVALGALLPGWPGRIRPDPAAMETITDAASP